MGGRVETILHLGFKMAGSEHRSQEQERGPIANRQCCVDSVVPWEQGVVSLSRKSKQQAKHKAAGSAGRSRELTEFHQYFIYLIFHI